MNKRSLSILWFLSLIIALFAGLSVPPSAPVKPDTLVIHDKVMIDDYTWLKNTESPEVKSYLKLEQKYASAMMKPSVKLSKLIYREFINRLNETETTHPYFSHGYYYYSRTEKGKSFSIHCRKLSSLSAPEEIILNENKLAGNKPFFSLGTMSISPDQKLLAYSTDENGCELYSLFIKDLATGKTHKTPFHNVSEAIWMVDSHTLLISTMNSRMQTDTVLRWKVYTTKADTLYRETDPAWDISLYSNCDETMIFLSVSSKDASETYYLPGNDTAGKFICLMPRRLQHIYTPDYYNGRFYISTNLYQADFDIVVSDIQSPDDWTILYKGYPSEPIANFLLLDKNLVILQRKQGFKTLVITDRKDGTVLDSITPEFPSDLNFWVNLDPLADEFYYTMENDITPLTVKSYNFNTKTTLTLRQYLPAGDSQLSNYDMALVWVEADDGKQIPMTVTFRKHPELKSPLYVKLSGYGAYGDSNDPYFSSTALSYLDRGFILATAHIRGGGEFGQGWYDDGRLLNKKNTFTDFIACMDYFLERGITDPQHLIIEGGSAGGLLMGAVVNQTPEKCALVIADVPFVDLIQTMLDDSLPLTIQEYEEWGNPHEQEYFDYMLSYSPIENVKPQKYPAMLISAALNDTRVGVWEAVRWTAKLRAKNKGTRPVILKINKDEGHTGQVDRYKALKSYSATVSYILHYMKTISNR